MMLQRQAAKKRAFTLTELAIVLGIVGLILGAIWVAAAAVYQNQRVATTTRQILAIAQSVRSIYSTQQLATGITAVNLAKAGGVPTDMLNSATNPTTVTDLWGGAVTVTAATQLVAGDAFAITLRRVPQSACVTLATSLTGPGRDSGLLGVDPAAAINTVFPVTLARAVAMCPGVAVAGNPITFTFKLKS